MLNILHDAFIKAVEEAVVVCRLYGWQISDTSPAAVVKEAFWACSCDVYGIKHRSVWPYLNAVEEAHEALMAYVGGDSSFHYMGLKLK